MLLYSKSELSTSDSLLKQSSKNSLYTVSVERFLPLTLSKHVTGCTVNVHIYIYRKSLSLKDVFSAIRAPIFSLSLSHTHTDTLFTPSAFAQPCVFIVTASDWSAKSDRCVLLAICDRPCNKTEHCATNYLFDCTHT